MEFALSPEQEALRDQAARFCERSYSFAQRHDILAQPDGFSRTHWASFAGLGWLGAPLREAEGGYGGVVEAALLQEVFGASLVVEPFLASAIVATRAIRELIGPETENALIDALMAGETIAALAHAEGGRNPLETTILSTASRSNSGWRISGRKSFVLSAPHADVVLVSAHTEGNPGLSLFAVPADSAGLVITRYRAIDGRQVADLALDGVTLDAAALLGAEGEAGPAIATALDYGAVALCAEAVGAMETAMRMTRDYLKDRRQFGTAIGGFQALQHRMADMHVESVLARSMMMRAIAALDDPDPASRARIVSAAKIKVSEAGMFVCGQSIQLHGGIGLTEEYAVGHFFKRLVLIRGMFGDNAAHLRRFSALSRHSA